MKNILYTCTLAGMLAVAGVTQETPPSPSLVPPVDSEAPAAAEGSGGRTLLPALRSDRTPPKPSKVHLHRGMHRQQVRQLLGEPENESVIHSIRRAKATYRDSTIITYVNEIAVMLQTGQKVELQDNGSAVFQSEDSTITVDANLYVPSTEDLLTQDPRAALKRPQFWYAGPTGGYTLYDGMHFTPAAPQCCLINGSWRGRVVYSRGRCTGQGCN